MEKGNPRNRFSTEVTARVVRLVHENENNFKTLLKYMMPLLLQ
jgi:hypothetical protein